MSGYKWLDKLATLPHNFTTSYCILNINSVKLVSSLQPKLKLVMNQLQASCVYTVHSQCLRLIAMAKEHLEVSVIVLCMVFKGSVVLIYMTIMTTFSIKRVFSNLRLIK